MHRRRPCAAARAGKGRPGARRARSPGLASTPVPHEESACYVPPPGQFKGSRAYDVGGVRALGYTPGVPLYEYHCTACRKRVTVLTLRVGEEVHPTCDRCGSTALERLMSRFAMVRSEES